jgi:hypothetical protein
VESEYRILYSRFTGQKNRRSVRHALSWQNLNIGNVAIEGIDDPFIEV